MYLLGVRAQVHVRALSTYAGIVKFTFCPDEREMNGGWILGLVAPSRSTRQGRPPVRRVCWAEAHS